MCLGPLGWTRRLEPGRSVEFSLSTPGANTWDPREPFQACDARCHTHATWAGWGLTLVSRGAGLVCPSALPTMPISRESSYVARGHRHSDDACRVACTGPATAQGRADRRLVRASGDVQRPMPSCTNGHRRADGQSSMHGPRCGAGRADRRLVRASGDVRRPMPSCTHGPPSCRQPMPCVDMAVCRY